ncbi:MAG: HAD-IIA family hydrolase [Actinomycetaceae bacterium]|nr:HAD-IIA family hydrolase [Actinomycetaceae bacterium]MDY6083251.1 HAD-IIA family hydrolase [Actinomycetaceae bacterium]
MRALYEAYDGALCDLDGVCYLGSEPIPYAAESIAATQQAGLRYVFLTNNASRTHIDIAEQLAGFGIQVDPHQIYGSADAALRLAADMLPGGASILLVGGDGLREAASSYDFRYVTSADDHPMAVIHGWYPEVDWAALSEVALAIRAGARYIATNVDPTIPRERGGMIGQGSLVAAVENSTGVNALSGGKPAAGIFEQAAQRGKLARPVVIGDGLSTDLAGAHHAGYDSIHVLTGVTQARDICLADAETRPSYVLRDLRGLLQPYPQVRVGVSDGISRASVGAWSAQVSEREVVVSSDEGAALTLDVDPLPVDAYRALAYAWWNAADRGIAVHASMLPELRVED